MVQLTLFNNFNRTEKSDLGTRLTELRTGSTSCLTVRVVVNTEQPEHRTARKPRSDVPFAYSRQGKLETLQKWVQSRRCVLWHRIDLAE